MLERRIQPLMPIPGQAASVWPAARAHVLGIVANDVPRQRSGYSYYNYGYEYGYGYGYGPRTLPAEAIDTSSTRSALRPVPESADPHK